MKGKLIGAVLLIGVVALLYFASRPDPALASRGADTPEDGHFLLTIDGYGVTEDEFRFFLQQTKSQTTYDFYQKYGAQMHADYWHTEYDGQTPLDYAKELALQTLTRAKIQFIMAQERGIAEYRDFDRLQQDMEAENADRAEKQETGEVFYGLKGYDMLTYFNYTQSNLAAELGYSQRKLSNPTRAELEDVYRRHLDSFYLGTVYEYEIQYHDGKRETITQSDMEIGKGDDLTAMILDELSYRKVGEVIKNVPCEEGTADILFLAVTPLGIASFSDVESGLRELFAQEELGRIIAQRAQQAELVIDEARFAAMEMDESRR